MGKYSVTGMSCAACVARVEKAVKALPGVDSCAVSLLTHSMQVDGSVSSSDVIAAVEKVGYGATPAGDFVQGKGTTPALSAASPGVDSVISYTPMAMSEKDDAGI